MTNTHLRIISALILTAIFTVAFMLGRVGLFSLLLVTGVIIIDEFMAKMIKVRRFSFNYFFSMASFCTLILYIQFIDNNNEYFEYLFKTGALINFAFLIYLFFEKMDSQTFISALRKNSYIVGFIFLTYLSSILYIVNQTNWTYLILLLFLVNFTVDTGAWFFGRRYGNKKIWPAVSPKKTINGAIGGSILSVVISSAFSFYFIDKLNFIIILSIFSLTVLAQLGDFFESKLKRQVGVKDSSNLIPGHGGIYDRIDSLVFIAPFYAIMVSKLY
jgi:phosphatidate cytidylyltransferase